MNALERHQVRQRATAAMLAIFACLVVRGLEALAVANHMALLTDASERASGNLAQIQSSGALFTHLELASLVAFAMAAIFFFRWWHAAFEAARVHGASGGGVMDYTTLIIFWLVPVCSLYWPYQVMRQLGREVDPRDVEPEVEEPVVAPRYRDAALKRVAVATASPPTWGLAAWWTAWLLGCLLNLIGYYALLAFGDLGGTRADEAGVFRIFLLCFLTQVIGGLLLIRVISALTVCSEQRILRVTSSCKREANPRPPSVANAV